MRFKSAGKTLAAFIALAALCGYTRELKVNPQVRYQEYIGVGGTIYGAFDYNMYINDMGCKVARVHLEKDNHLDIAQQAKNAANNAGKAMTVIGSIWTPPGNMKIGPFYPGNCADGYNECGGTLDPSKYDEFGAWVNGKLDRYKNAGLPMYALCLQNEPWLEIWYISCTYTAQQYIDMFKNVAPIVKNSHPNVQLMIAEMWLGPATMEKALLLVPEAARHVDILAWHGAALISEDMSARHDGPVTKTWKGRQAVANQIDKSKFRPVWQTECNLLCGWTSTSSCSWGAGYETSGPSFPEGCNMLAMFRYAYGQVWTTYGINSEFQDAKRRQVYTHFGRYIDTGAEMIDCEQDTANDIATVAFHHRQKKALTIVTVKGSTGNADVSFNIPGLQSSGRWYMSDNNLNFDDRGALASGQTITLYGQSMATMYWENYDPDIAGAAYPLKEGSVSVRPSVPQKDVTSERAVGSVNLHDLQGRAIRGGVAGKAPGVVVAVERLDGSIRRMMLQRNAMDH